jgi:hypothetical protein
MDARVKPGHDEAEGAKAPSETWEVTAAANRSDPHHEP